MVLNPRRTLIVVLILGLLSVLACGEDESDSLSTFNYPNPCRLTTGTTIVVKYQAAKDGKLSLYFYVNDRAGSPVLVQNRVVAVTTGPNTIEIPWDLTNDRGTSLSPGPYILKVTSEGLEDSLSSHTAWNRILVK